MLTNNTEENAQNKLLLLYIIKLSPIPLTNEKLTELVLEKSYINYFFIQQYISELIENEFIELIENENNLVYSLLSRGEESLDYFQSKIPDSIKQELTEEFKIKKLLKIKDSQIIADYYLKENNQYTVNLKLVENEDTLFSLYLNVATADQGIMICNSWKNDTENIYKNIINMFIKE